MKITDLIARAILASGAVATPLHPVPFKNRTSKIQKHQADDIPPITTSVTLEGFIEPSFQFPEETSATGLPFDSHPDNFEYFLTITTSASSDERQKNKTNAILPTYHGSRPTSHIIPKRDPAIATADNDLEDDLQDLLDHMKEHEQGKKHTKRSDSQIGQGLKRIRTIHTTKSDDEKAQRIIDQLQADITRYWSNSFSSHQEEINAIKHAEDKHRHLNVSGDPTLRYGEKLRDHGYDIDGKYHVIDSCAREAGENRLAPRHLIYSGLFPSGHRNKTAYSWNETSNLLEKRADSPNSSGDISESEFTQNAYPSVSQDLPFNAKLREGREALNQVRAYLDEKNKVHYTNGSLPAEFNNVWKVITQYSLPVKFKQAYMEMVRDYRKSAPHQTSYPQDSSSHNPVNSSSHSKLARRRPEPALLKNVTEHDVDSVASEAKKITAAASENLNSSATSNPSTHLRRDLSEKWDKLESEVSEPYSEIKNATEEAYERFTSKVKNYTSHTTGKLNSSATFEHSNNKASKRSTILSIDGEEAYRKFHAKNNQSAKTGKRQTTPEQEFSQDTSEQAIERYVQEIEQNHDPKNGYQPPKPIPSVE
jgi:hypothetical protein